MTHPIAKALEADPGVVVESRDERLVGPATDVLERLGQVPVVERDYGGHARAQQAVYEPVIVGQASRVDVTRRPVGKDARPGQRETILRRLSISIRR